MALNVPGVVAVVLFYILILGTGVWAARKSRRVERKSSGDRTEVVLLGDRNISLMVGIFTMTATWVGGGFILGVAEAVYTPHMGLIWALMPLQYSVSFIIGGLFFAKPMREKNYITMMDPFQRKYGKVLSGALVLPCLLVDVLWVSCTLLGLGATMSVILDLPFSYSVWISAAVAIIYTLLGGLYSVAYTDVIQLTLTFLSLWLCVPFLLLNKTSVNIAETAFNHTFQEPWVGSLDRDRVWEWIDDFLMLGLGSVSFQSFHQRTLSAASSLTAQLTCYAAAVFIAVLGIPPVLVGAVAASTDWNMTLYGSPPPYVRNEHSYVLPLTLQNLAPPSISIIGIGAVAAAVMSSTDSGLLSATSVFSSNIYKNVLRTQASDSEMKWVIRFSVVVVGLVGTSITFCTNSTLVLWILGADLSYTLMFPHLVSVLFFKVTNGYGATVGYILGVSLRILLGENSLGLPVVLRLPGCTLENGVYVQRSPIRTVAMLCTLVTILLFSALALFVFNRGLLPESWDVFKVKRPVAAPPADPVTQNLKGGAGTDDAECEEDNHGVPLQPLSQTGK
ncbi:high-affinity choline transporter 1 [Kryptolebias marmoratus]|uniref:High-affinity choline transporter 1-like n=1 Tax=Kryptolebias marmoratus TaxID=37003 RepID=A0A3Q3GVW3_KRYMA|nr:high-affinity choline transporter 1 [Kryptolebias marmoratus]XP_017287918.1 high-affinity choline transporter 1 [Kryptolebias marmoratus]XP_024865397.1 high-affinity choline transporter 1 [Kryptolebias marmoratus]XP_024865398.1 high-affinity choline transporter 1 [Kryptolebias marmoratus]